MARGDIRSGGFDLNGLWSPWYTLHKTYAGLRDAYRFTGNPTALELEIRFAAWAEGILAKLDDAQVQRMLNTEFGGMNEIFADLYADTGDKRWLDLSYQFEHRAFTEPLKRHQDNLAGKHGNTQVPKMIGSLARFAVHRRSRRCACAAGFFWDRVVQHHSYATGGHGKDEYFGEPDKLNDRVDGRTAETCNVYNMLKLTRQAVRPAPRCALRRLPRAGAVQPHPRLAGSAGRLGLLHGAGGPRRAARVRAQHARRRLHLLRRVSSMESHALHGDGLYYESGDKLWVNLYAPSTAEWPAAGVKLDDGNRFPGRRIGDAAADASTRRKEFTLALRRPFWAGDGLLREGQRRSLAVELRIGTAAGGRARRASVRLAHRSVRSSNSSAPGRPATPSPSRCPRRCAWNRCRTIRAAWPSCGDRWCWRAIWATRTSAPARRAQSAGRSARCSSPPSGPWPTGSSRWPDKPGWFRTEGVGKDRDVDFVPFYRLHRRTYADLLGPVHAAGMGAARRRNRRRAREAAPARSRHRRLRPAGRDAGRARRQHAGRGHRARCACMGRPGRRGAQVVLLRPAGGPGASAGPGRRPTTTTNGRSARSRSSWTAHAWASRPSSAAARCDSSTSNTPCRPRLVKGKPKVTVKFQATQGNEIGAVYGIRMIRADAER